MVIESVIVAALITAVATAVGWLINHILHVRETRQSDKINYEIRFTERQLEELYGPLVFLIYEGESTLKDLLIVLGRSTVFETHQDCLVGDDLKAWFYWTENDFLPRNDKVKELISTKAHLVEGDRIPDSWLHFLEHVNSWKVNHDRWKIEKVEYSWRSRIDWPTDFSRDVVETFQMLKSRYSNLIARRVS